MFWAAGVDALPGDGPIVAVPVGAASETVATWRRRVAARVFDAGVYVNAAFFPVVPRDEGILRLSVMATHTEEQLERGVAAITSSMTGQRSSGRTIDLPGPREHGAAPVPS